MSVILIMEVVNKYVLILMEISSVPAILDIVVTSSAQVNLTQYYWTIVLFVLLRY